VAPDASPEAIRRAFRNQAKQTHPDRNPNDPTAARRFQKVQNAYAVLSDPERRARYDARRAGRPTTAPSHVTASSIDTTGCVGYYLPRLAVGLVASLAFFVLEVAGVWSTRDPWHLALWITGASVATSAVAIGVFRAFPDESRDYAVRFRRKDLTIWMEGAVVLQVPWAIVKTINQEEANVWSVAIPLPHLPPVDEHPPVLHVQRIPSIGIAQLRIDLRATDVPTASLRRFLAAYGPRGETRA
jgi:hypothetical protein